MKYAFALALATLLGLAAAIRRTFAALVLGVTLAQPAFAAALTLAFTPDPARGGGALSPEGCYLEPGPTQGLLTTSSAGSVCHSGLLGPFPGTGIVAGDLERSVEPANTFTTAPLATPLRIGGRTTLRLYIFSDEPSFDAHRLEVLYRIEELRSDGSVIAIASGIAMSGMGTYYEGRDGSFEIPAHTVAAGSRLRVNLTVSGPTSGRLLFGDESVAEDTGLHGLGYSFADAGITFEGRPDSRSGGLAAGSLGLALLPLCFLVLLRRCCGAGRSAARPRELADPVRHILAGLHATARYKKQEPERACIPGSRHMNQPLTRTRLASSVGALLLCALGAAQAGDLGFALVPDALPAGVLSPEGCFTDAGLAHGKLGAPLAGNTCHSGLVGNGLAVFVEDPEDPQAFVTADFTSEPFSAGLALLGPMALRVHAVFDPVGLAGYLAACGGLLCEPLGQQLGFYLDEVRADGAVEYLAGGSFPHVPYAGVLKQEPISGAFDVGPHRLAPGSRLRLRLYANEAAFGECDPSAPSTACAPPRGVFPYVSSVGARLLYGGEPLLPGRIKDSAVSFAVASAAATAPETDVPPTPVPGVDDDIPVAGQPAEDDAGPGEQRSASGGSLPVAVLAVLAVFGALRLGRGARRARQPAFEVR